MARKRRDLPWLDTRGGTFYVFWYDPKTRRTERLSLRTRSCEEAKHRFAAFLVEGGEIYRPGRPAGLTVGKALDDYFDEHVKTEVIDQARIEDAITHLKAHFDTTPVPDVTIPMCRAYVLSRRTGAIAAKTPSGEPRLAADGTIRRELGALVAAINHAVKWGRLPRGSAPSIELPKPPPPKELWFTREEMTRLLAAATGRTRDFIEIAYYTAGRRRAVESLTKFQVDLRQSRINLNTAGRQQTKKRRPVVPIDPALKPTIERCMRESKTEYLLSHPGSVRTGFATALRRAGLEVLPARGTRPEGRPSPHVLRHSRATHLLQAGVSPWSVAGLLGDTLTTVVSTYGHHCPDYLAEAMREGREKEILE